MEQLEVSLKNGEMKYGLCSNSDYSKRHQALQSQAIENEDLQQRLTAMLNKEQMVKGTR